MEGIDRSVVELKQRLATGADDETSLVRLSWPAGCDGRRELCGGSEFTSVRADADEISITEVADRGGAIQFAPRPQIAAGEATENRRATGVGAFALERVENL